MRKPDFVETPRSQRLTTVLPTRFALDRERRNAGAPPRFGRLDIGFRLLQTGALAIWQTTRDPQSEGAGPMAIASTPVSTSAHVRFRPKAGVGSRRAVRLSEWLGLTDVATRGVRVDSGLGHGLHDIARACHL